MWPTKTDCSWLKVTLVATTLSLPFVIGPLLYVSPRDLRGDQIIVHSLTLPNSEWVALIQQWVGDGYLTEVKHMVGTQEALSVLAPDSSKIRYCSATVYTNQEIVAFRVGHAVWQYNYREKRILMGMEERKLSSYTEPSW